MKWVRDVLNLYYDYYIDVMALSIDRQEAEKKLLKSMTSLSFMPDLNCFDVAEVVLEEKFRLMGWSFLGGYTAPFRGPYIYEELESHIYSIDLPNDVVKLPIKFMKKFHSLSWLEYATFGAYSTGGWAKSDGLYCVIDGYDQTSPKFLISYLKHEAQHFNDHIQFPIIKDKQDILEFRAKLAEIIYYNSNGPFLSFINEAKNDTNFPHLYASYQIKLGFEKKLSISKEQLLNIDVDTIKKVALDLFNENTNDLHKSFCWGKPL